MTSGIIIFSWNLGVCKKKSTLNNFAFLAEIVCFVFFWSHLSIVTVDNWLEADAVGFTDEAQFHKALISQLAPSGEF